MLFTFQIAGGIIIAIAVFLYAVAYLSPSVAPY
jgi:hypothetical protein